MPKCTAFIRKKGAIAVGFDADIVLWDANRKEVTRQDILHHGADYMSESFPPRLRRAVARRVTRGVGT
jgi:imidazolonepropionase-like amidohydrolase